MWWYVQWVDGDGGGWGWFDCLAGARPLSKLKLKTQPVNRRINKELQDDSNK